MLVFQVFQKQMENTFCHTCILLWYDTLYQLKLFSTYCPVYIVKCEGVTFGESDDVAS